MNRWRRLVLVLLASGIFYAIVWPDAPWIVSDSQGYLESAADLRDLRLDRLHDRTPGYPLLLLATGASRNPGRLLFLVQLVLQLASVLLLATLLERAAVGTLLIAAFVGFALLPPRVAAAGHVLTECWTQFLLVGALFGWMSWLEHRRVAWLFAIGLMLGLAALTRPTYVLLAVAWLPVALVVGSHGSEWRVARPAMVLCTLAPTLLLLGGLCLHNQRHFAFPAPSPLFGFNLSTRTLRVLERLPDQDATVRAILIRHRDRDLVEPHGTHLGTMFIWHAREELEAATGLSRPELSAYLARLNLMLIRKAPLEYAVEVGHSMVSYWFPWLPEAANFGSRALQMLWTLLHAVTTAAFFVVMLVSAAMAVLVASVRSVRTWVVAAMELPDRRCLAGASFALVTIFYTMIVSCAVEIGTPRYRGPTDLLILFVTVLGLALWSRWRSRARSSLRSEPLVASAAGV